MGGLIGVVMGGGFGQAMLRGGFGRSLGFMGVDITSKISKDLSGILATPPVKCYAHR